MIATEDIALRVLSHWDGLRGATIESFGGGLINQTFRVTAGATRFVLQHVNPIFPPAIHENILAVTDRLAAAGLTTPRLVPTRDGRLCVDLGGPGGVWRLTTFIEGVTFDVVTSPAQARAAAALVGRFHRALDGLPHVFVGMRAGVHDTPRHLSRLPVTVAAHAGHRLHREVGILAAEIFAGAAALPALPPLADRVCHGDPKFNNVLFAGPDPGDRERAVCLIDLDTVGPLSLAAELGDAWRSWCNRAGEDDASADVDLEILAASAAGYQEGLGRDLRVDERQALLLGPEWISLELACRFAADALDESYFGWNAARFAGRGEHNLVRARGQWSLHHAFVASRAQRAALLGLPRR